MIEGLNDVVLKYAGLNESGWKEVESAFTPPNIFLKAFVHLILGVDNKIFKPHTAYSNTSMFLVTTWIKTRGDIIGVDDRGMNKNG